MQKHTAKIIISASLFFSTGSVAGADTIHKNEVIKNIQVKETKQEEVSREQYFNLLKNAANIQLSFGENLYSKEEIIVLMKPYFTQKFIDQFISENMFEFEEGKFGILGTDFAPNIIPYFSYGENTEVREEGDVVQMTEFFEAVEDAPVSYKGHKESVNLINEKGNWKVDVVIYEMNEVKSDDDFSLEHHALEVNPQYVQSDISSEYEAVTLTSFFNWKPYEATVGATFRDIISEWDRIFSLKTWQK
ncbi:DUF3993 domain-containing protein [Peribacillus acanthi]|uniref:DUF3993 domain-containing protein n=1 Tax=Peribacillus acanthi TaxID=2171554 RepID=UPI000D3ED18A|nr:DUF3993 domain-containing protein [Peribacillus acanthi]